MKERHLLVLDADGKVIHDRDVTGFLESDVRLITSTLRNAMRKGCRLHDTDSTAPDMGPRLLSQELLDKVDEITRRIEGLFATGRLRPSVHEQLAHEMARLRETGQRLADRESVTAPAERKSR